MSAAFFETGQKISVSLHIGKGEVWQVLFGIDVLAPYGNTNLGGKDFSNF